MLRVDQAYVIRHKVLVEGVRIRRVAREMGISRNTVRKYLSEPEPRRRVSKARGRPVAEKVTARLEALIEEWGARTTAKQRITAARLHRELIGEGYRAGITLVQDWLRERRRKAAEVYVPLVHRAGDEAQVDFFDVTVEVRGERRRVWMFVMRLMYSGRDFAWLYEWADQVSFLDGHVRAFEHFGCLPHRLIYDNLSSAVRRLVLPERELTARFQALASHYLFEPCFTRPGTGHDKGGVEARGKGIRLQELTPIPSGQSLAEINGRLLEQLDCAAGRKRNAEGRTVIERFEEERSKMLPLAEVSFQARKLVMCSVSSRSLVQIDGATYSVPSHWKHLEVKAFLGATDVKMACRGEEISAERQRFGQRHIRYRHYLPELARKPQAVRQVAAELLAELDEPFGALWRLLVDTHGPRQAARHFAGVLAAVVDHGEKAVASAIERAMKSERTDLLELAHLLHRSTAAEIVVPESLAAYTVEKISARTYDRLLVAEPEDRP